MLVNLDQVSNVRMISDLPPEAYFSAGQGVPEKRYSVIADFPGGSKPDANRVYLLCKGTDKKKATDLLDAIGYLVEAFKLADAL